jgi:hypothetical protein
MRTDILLTIFYITISLLSGLCFLYEFLHYKNFFIITLEFFVLSGSFIYYGYLAIIAIMKQQTVKTTTVINGWFRYTLYFTFSSKFLFCLILCTTLCFISDLIKNNFKTLVREDTTLDLFVLIFIYGVLPIANTLNLVQYVRVMKVTSRNDITAIFILSLIWFIYMMIMTCIMQNPKFGDMLTKCLTYTFLRIFIVISGLPVHDYFFLYNTNKDSTFL